MNYAKPPEPSPRIESDTECDKPILFAIASPTPRSGKDTVANILCSVLKLDNAKFASSLRTLATYIVDTVGHVKLDISSYEAIYYDQHKDQKIIKFGERLVTPREFLISLGTDAIRENLDSQFFINRTPKAHCVISDCRLRNELDYARENGATVIWVENSSLSEEHYAKYAGATEGNITAEDCDLIIVAASYDSLIDQALSLAWGFKFGRKVIQDPARLGLPAPSVKGNQ